MALGLSAGLLLGVGALIALAVLVAAARALGRLAEDRRPGAFVAVDLARAPGPRLVAPRYRLAGRPDELRRRPDGRVVPVEFKSRDGPAGGPLPSHRIQVAAYCLLIEETTGRAPPFGLVRYGDGTEYTVPWDAEQRAELLRLLGELRQPYDGRARPSARRCARCAFRPGCDAAAV